MTTWIRIESGADAGTCLDLETIAGRIVLGSDVERATFALDDPAVAPLHAVLGRLRDGSYGVRATAPECAFLVNDRSTEQAKLRGGDLLVLGSTRVSFHEGEPLPAAAPMARAAEPPESPESPEPTDEAPEDPLVGRELGGYRVLERLGVGGMGKVYRALQISLDREVALKLLSEELAADEGFAKRFLEEARAAGKLAHPNVVQVYDVGRDGTQLYYSMEFLPGGTLEDRLRRDGRIPWREAVTIVRDAARALSYAESLRIVHRDIKPDNLMLDPHGHAKLADLGLAGSHDESARHGGSVLGTPHFISPEQALGKPVDARSDLYSLGATCYRLLTGRTPFHGNSVREIIRAQVQDEPEPVSAHAPEVPETVELILARLMEKDPAERYASARELIHDLDAVLEGRATAGGASPLRWAGIALGVLVLGAVGYVAFGGSGGGGNGAPREAPHGANGDTTGRETPVVVEGPDGPRPPVEEDGRPPGPSPQEMETARQLREARARIAFDEALAAGDRVRVAAALRVVENEYAGTEYGTRAGTEAQARETDQARLTAALTDGRTALEERLERGAFEEALTVYPEVVAALPEPLRQDPLLADGRRALVTRLLESIGTWLASRPGAVRELVDGQRYQDALAEIERIAERVDQLTQNDLLTAHREDLLRTLAPLTQLREEVVAARRAYRSERFEAERIAATAAMFAEDGVPKWVQQHAPGRAAAELTTLLESVTDQEIRDALAPHRDALLRAERAFARLRTLPGDRGEPLALDHPESGRKMHVLGVDAEGLRLARRRDDPEPERLPFARILQPATWAMLFEASAGPDAEACLDAAHALWITVVVREAQGWQRALDGYLQAPERGFRSALLGGLDEAVDRLVQRSRNAGADPEALAAFARYRAPDDLARQALRTVEGALRDDRFALALELVEQVQRRGRGGFFFGLLSQGRDAFGLDRDQ